MNTAETISYDSRFSSPFINPPESSSAGRKHKNKSINALGVNPYSMSQVGFAAGGLTPEGYTYPFRMVSKGKSRPVAPKDVAKKSREYELQLLKGGLASLGFTDAKDLNSVFGPNVQADFLAKKGGTPYLIDAKAGYNDAKLSQMEKKGATIAALRKTKAYKNYLQSLGMNDQDVRTAIVFGNAGTQQQKTLRKKGILRSAKGGGGGGAAIGAGRVFENVIGLASGLQKKYREDNETLDYPPISFPEPRLREKKKNLGLARRTLWGDAKLGDNDNSLNSYVSKLIRSGAGIKSGGVVKPKNGGSVILPASKAKRDKFVNFKTTGKKLIKRNPSLEGLIDEKAAYSSRVYKRR